MPSKNEDLRKSTIVLGAEVITYLKRNGAINIEELFAVFAHREQHPISLPHFYDVITFLWMIGIVDNEGYLIKLKKS